jgi:DNA-binding CsgD family transcriptional regulator
MGEKTSVHRDCHLTDREVDVLAKLAAGHTSEEAAEALGISVHTVIRHVGNMLARLGAPNRLWLVARAFSAGVLRAGVWPPTASGSRCMGGCGPDGCPPPAGSPGGETPDVCRISGPR